MNINRLMKLFVITGGVLVLLFGLASCNTNNSKETATPWGIKEPLIESFLNGPKALTEYSKNPRLNLHLGDQILFDQNEGLSFSVQTTCQSLAQETHEAIQGSLPKKIKILELLPHGFLYSLSNSHKFTKCLFQFNIQNANGDTHKFSLGPSSVDRDKNKYYLSQFKNFQDKKDISYQEIQQELDLYFKPELAYAKVICSEYKFIFIIYKDNESDLIELLKKKYPQIDFRGYPQRQLCQAIGFEEGRIKEITPPFYVNFPWRQIKIPREPPLKKVF